jgi:hypothetical protein
VPLSAVRSARGSMLGSLLENMLGGGLGNVHNVYLGASSEHSWERKSSWLGVTYRVPSGGFIRVYFGACNEVDLAVWFQYC